VFSTIGVTKAFSSNTIVTPQILRNITNVGYYKNINNKNNDTNNNNNLSNIDNLKKKGKEK
jgi:hypothetical protein